MNSAQTAQRGNMIFFFFAVFFSILMLLASAYLARVFLAGEADGEPHTVASCVSMLNSNGFNPTVQGEVITSIRAANEDIESLVNQAGVLIALCPSHTIKSFCAGQGCKIPGLDFTLVPR